MYQIEKAEGLKSIHSLCLYTLNQMVAGMKERYVAEKE